MGDRAGRAYVEGHFLIPSHTRKLPPIACSEVYSILAISPGADEDECKLSLSLLPFVRRLRWSCSQNFSFCMACSKISNCPPNFSFHACCIDDLSLQKDQKPAYSIPRIGAVPLQMYKETISVDTEKHPCKTMADGSPIVGDALSSFPLLNKPFKMGSNQFTTLLALALKCSGP